MNIKKAERLARSLMGEHGLTDWTFKFDNAKKRFGQCSHNEKTISLSFYLVAMNDEDEVVETIKHEIAHALASPNAGHGFEWKATARSIGASPNRTYDDLTVASPEGRWIAYYPVHGALTKPRHRRTKNRVCKWCLGPVEWKEKVDD